MSAIGQIRLVRFHDQEKTSDGVRSSVKVAFTKRGRKFLKVITVDAPIRVRKVRIADERYMVPLRKGDDFYPYKRAVQKFLKAAKHLGITDGAKKILVEARGAIPADDDVK